MPNYKKRAVIIVSALIVCVAITVTTIVIIIKSGPKLFCTGDLPISDLTLDVSEEQLHINWQYHGPNDCRYDFLLYVYGDSRFISLERVNTTSYTYPDYNSCIKYDIEVTAQGSFDNKGNTLNASHIGNDSITISDLVLGSQGTYIYSRWNYLGNPECDVTYAVNVTRNNEWSYPINVKMPSFVYTFLYVGCQNYSFEVTPRIPSGKTEASLVDVYMAPSGPIRYILFSYIPEEGQWAIYWSLSTPYCTNVNYLVAFKQRDEDPVLKTVTNDILYVNVTVPTCSVINITITPIFLGEFQEPTTIIRHAAQNMIRNATFAENDDFIIFQWRVLDECLSLNITYNVRLFQSQFVDVIETTESKATFPKKVSPCSEVTAEVRVILEDYDQYERPFTYTTVCRKL